MSRLVVVESPSKAKTLKKYLGKGYDVLASSGHVRDLVPKQGAVDPDHDFAMKYQLIPRNAKYVDAITKAAAAADEILLATDPDREGEAIAWHVSEILRSKKNLRNKTVRRVVFHEITQDAIRNAMAHPRDISMELVNAQQARRALDYLVGFNLSPLLWRKISPGLSAGRVQSPALRLIVEREQEIEAFRPVEYWTLHLDSHKGHQSFSARLIQHRGKKLEQLSIGSAETYAQTLAELGGDQLQAVRVARVEKKQRLRNAAPPFTTSTLQQEAVRKLGFSTKLAMRIAQQLYEGIDVGEGAVGLITYMRTDSVSLANEAVEEIRRFVAKTFSPEHLPKTPVTHKNKTKNAQEAHEAIRPTSVLRTPEAVQPYLSAEQAKLYEIIWKRAVASQMSPAKFDATVVDLAPDAAGSLFRATGQTLVFAGFMEVYQEDADDSAEEEDTQLPILQEGETLPVDKLYGDQHFTQPPPRFSEASLVKTLEEYGIGRPSTYASIISTLLDREYVVLDKKRFVPASLGRMVNHFLTEHFNRYVDYGFTAQMEDDLDKISTGRRTWLPVLKEFWNGFHLLIQEKQQVAPGQSLNEACPECGKDLFLRSSRRGLFVGCSGYPECNYTRPWEDQAREPARTLGIDPATGQEVRLLQGPYGHYVQLGQQTEGGPKPKRASWPKALPREQADLERALKLLAMPASLGLHPETGLSVDVGVGRFGPYVRHNGMFVSVPKAQDFLALALDEAVTLLKTKKTPAGSPATALGMHPADGKPITVQTGRYGPYVRHGTVFASLPKDQDPATLSLQQALDLLAAKADVKKTVAPKGKRASATPKRAASKPKSRAPESKKAPAK